MTTVRDIMSTELVTVDPSTTLTEAARVMSIAGAGSALVLEERSLVGILTERDILRALGESASADLARVSSVQQWMSADPETVSPETTAADALERMLFRAFRHLPVVEEGRVVGVVSMRDLAERLSAG